MEHVLVIGAGVAGLGAALAFHAKGFKVTVLDRDEPLPDDLQAAESWDWKRGAAPQVRQPHFLMGRLRNLLHDRYPGLVQDLLDAGVWEMSFADTIHPYAKDSYEPKPGDRDMTPLCSRRTTFEMVMRRYIENSGVADLRAGCKVDELVLDTSSKPYRVTGCQVTCGDESDTIAADVVIDTSGRGSNLVSKLQDCGVDISEEHHKSETIYNTRHYRLREGQKFPDLMGLPAVDFPDFTLGALPADNGTLTVTLAVWRDDPVLSKYAKNVDFFEAFCASVPKVRDWADPARVEPVSNIISFANMDYLWRNVVTQDGPQVLNYFLAGDSAIRTNPKFGRGCTWGTVSVHKLADILAEHMDPAGRIVQYEQMLRDEFRSDWETMYALEQGTRAKFKAMLSGEKKSLKLKMTSAIENHVMNVAMLAEPRVQRAIMRGYHGLDEMSAWTRDPRVWFDVARAARPSRKLNELRRTNAARPSRSQFEAMAQSRAS